MASRHWVTHSGPCGQGLQRILCLSESTRVVVLFPLKYNCLISTTCQTAVKYINHVPNSHTVLTFNSSYSALCLPEVSFHPSPPLTTWICLPSYIYWVGRYLIILIYQSIHWFFTLTSSLWSLCWMSQVTVACGERGTHSSKVLLFSVP